MSFQPNRLAGFGWGPTSANNIPSGTPHDGAPGCVWDARLNDYACDDGYTYQGAPLPDDYQFPTRGVETSDDGLVTIDSAGPRTRDTTELSAAIKAAGGKLNVSGNDSAMIVALNNRLRFSVTNEGNGYYSIEDRLAGNNTVLIVGAAAAVLVLVVALSGR